jgi:iron(III) transport system substrate-binding protein
VIAASALVLAGCSSVSTASGGASASSGSAASQTSSGDMASLVKEAKAEGSLTIYTAIQANQMAPWTAAFKKKYGINVKILRLASAVLGTTFETQAQAGKNAADILQTSNLSQVQDFKTKGWIAKYTPASAGLYPSDRTVPGYMYPLYQSNGAIAWNTKVVSKSVQKKLSKNPYQALLDPSLKGKIVLIDPANGGSGMAYYANLVYKLGDKYGWSYLKKLAAQKPAISESIASISQEVSAGTYSATIFGDDAIFGPLAAQGAPVQYQGLSTMNVTQFVQAIPKAAPDPAAARLWQEWSTTVAGQQAMTAGTGGSSSAKGWKDNDTYKSDVSWYTPPKEDYLDWRTDPRLQGAKFTAFVAKWNTIFKGSSS